MAATMVRTVGRYAPSPSGQLHLGNLRTALAAWLAVRSVGGTFRLRVDDLDPARSRREHVHAQVADLAALGLDWDGPILHQSERAEIYRSSVRALEAAGWAYRCFCTRADIQAAAEAPHGEAGMTAYPGTCRRLSGRELQRRERAGDPWCLRVRAEGAEVQVDDLIQGKNVTRCDDFVVWRKDGVAAYNLAVVVDDAGSGVTQVVRGLDLLSTTGRQRWLAEALGLPVPQWAHVPLVLGPGGQRLAKRDGAVTLADQLARGHDAEAVRAMLARSLGIPGGVAEGPPAGLVDGFSLAGIPREAAVFDGDGTLRPTGGLGGAPGCR